MAWREDAYFGDVNIQGKLTLEGGIGAEGVSAVDFEVDDITLGDGAEEAASTLNVNSDDVAFEGDLAASTFDVESDDVTFSGALAASTFDVEQDDGTEREGGRDDENGYGFHRILPEGRFLST